VDAAAPPPRQETTAVAEAPLAYTPLAKSRLLLAAAIVLVLAAFAAVPVYEFGKDVLLRRSSQQAVAAADEFLRQQKVDPSTYRHVAWIDENVDPQALEYLVERKTLAQSEQIYRQATRLALWRVRYFRPLEKEEYLVFVDPGDGTIFGYRHELPEDAPGATLSPDQARDLAARAVTEHGYDVGGFELVNSEANQRKARKDYDLVWQAKPGDARNVGDAHYRLTVEIAGDQVVGFSRSFKLPEDWVREHRATHLTNVVLKGIGFLMIFSLVGAGLILFVRQVRSGQLPWKRSAKFGVLAAVAMLLNDLNVMVTFDRQYDTSIPLASFHLLIGIGNLVVFPLLAGLGMWLVVGLALSLFPDAWRLFTGSARRAWRR
jgi:hypothetical protein